MNPPSPDVASFHHLPHGPQPGQACAGTACFLARRAAGLAEVPAERPLYCLGQCFAAPAVAGDDARPDVYRHAREPVVLGRLAAGGARTLSRYLELGGGHGREQALRLEPGEVRAAVEMSGLRGRGGAGFPTGRKWQAAAASVAATPDGREIIANADEGDPGAFVDRFLLELDPFAVIEGLVIAARAVGAAHGTIYLRSEYPAARDMLKLALAEARSAGWLGPAALGPGRSFEVDLHLGAGSYVCGEETALVRSIEGLRPEPQPRPPYLTERGLWGRPTVVNNVETLANVPWILGRGPEAYRALGTGRSRGTKVFSLDAGFVRPGLHEVEFGASLRQLVEDFGGGLRSGRSLRAVLVGGPLAGLVPAAQFDTPLGFEELAAVGGSIGHGGVLGIPVGLDLASLARHVAGFAARESCGKCTPCRIGSRRLENGWPDDPALDELITALRTTSLCGLGTGLAEFAASVRRLEQGERESACRS